MNFKFSDILIGLIFSALVVGTAILQNDFKNEPQVIMLIFGLMTLASFFAKQPFKTSVPFYILLGTMICINVFIVTNLLLNIISPDNTRVVDKAAENHQFMNMNWIWGYFSGFLLSPLIVLLYHKRAKRNRFLEISLTAVFIVITLIIYLKNELI